jgi:hypothetical protein
MRNQSPGYLPDGSTTQDIRIVASNYINKEYLQQQHKDEARCSLILCMKY